MPANERARSVSRTALLGVEGMIVGEVDDTDSRVPHRDRKPLRRLVQADLAAMIGQRALAVDHDQIRAMENRRQPLQRMIQQGIVGRIVLGVFLVLQQRIAQAFGCRSIARALEAETLQVSSALTLIDIGI